MEDIGNFASIRLNTTLSTISEGTAGVEVTFSDGSRGTFDLVVGADGIRSQIREMVFGKEFLKPYGWTIYLFWTPLEVSPPKGAIEFSGAGKICLIYPMEEKGVVMLAIDSKKDISIEGKVSKEILQTMFSDFKDSIEFARFPIKF